jgi:CBS domain-containing protein
VYNVSRVLEEKGREIWSVDPDDLVYDAVRHMAEHGVGAMLVMKDGEMKGMFSERDYARRVVLAGRASRDTRVREVMTKSLITIDLDATAREGLEQMTLNRIRHLPVIDKGELVGLVSIGDLVNAVITDQQRLIKELKSYVRG